MPQLHRIAFDLETHLIAPGMGAPRMVCASVCEGGGAVLHGREEALAWASATVPRPDVVLVGANLPFDLAVLVAELPELVDAVFRLYAEGRAQCVQTRQKLLDIAAGELDFHHETGTAGVVKTEHSLAALSKRWLGRTMAKGDDTWRMRYAELEAVPLEDWPPEATEYALRDAEATWDVDQAQLKHMGATYGLLQNEAEQQRAHWALHLMSLWGVRTDGAMVARLRAGLEAEQEEAVRALRAAGVVRTALNKRTGLPTKQDGTTDTQKLADLVVAHHLRGEDQHTRDVYSTLVTAPRVPGSSGQLYSLLRQYGVPTTETGKVSLTTEVLEATNDPTCLIKAQSSNGAKLLSTYIPTLEAGAVAAVNARYNVLVGTGRTSCSSPNMQNPPRKGGVRECYIARPGRLFADVDYDTLELRSLAQVCLDLLGRSHMAEALRSGEDLHVRLAGQVLGMDTATAQRLYDAGDDQVSEMRQLCKIANFGFPGGMAAGTFVEYARGYGVTVRADVASNLRKRWFEAWPEMKDYFEKIGGAVRGGNIMQVRSNRLRGGIDFCSAANSLFQGLAADGAKQALWDVAVEAYTVPRSALYGSRPCIFMHDEIVAEVPEATAAAAAEQLAQTMREAMQKWIPDVPIGAKPALMRRWYKGAKPLYVNGALVPSKPEHQTGPDGKPRVVWVEDIDAAPPPVPHAGSINDMSALIRPMSQQPRQFYRGRGR